MRHRGLDEDPVSPDTTAILRCLEFLAQEAECLDLPETLSAIVHALETATRESGIASHPQDGAQAPILLH